MAYFKSYIKSFFSILFAILLIVIFETIAYIKNGKDNIISNAYLNGPQPFLYLEKETAEMVQLVCIHKKMDVL